MSNTMEKANRTTGLRRYLPGYLLLATSRWPRRVRQALNLLLDNPNMTFGAFIILGVSVMAIFAPLIARTDPVRISPIDRLKPPAEKHWFGTDHVGRDVYSRTIYGSRISLIVGCSVAAIVSLAGVSIGLVSGYFPKLDGIIMRIMDGLMAFPALLLAMALIAMLGSTVQNVIIALSVPSTPTMSRIVRGVVLSLRERDFVEASRALGTHPLRILLTHIFPNTVAPVIIQGTVVFAGAVLAEASLSFLGAGSPPYIPSWGNIMGQGRTYLQMAVWVTFFPGLFLSLTVLAINLVGDGLRDRLDPRLRQL